MPVSTASLDRVVNEEIRDLKENGAAKEPLEITENEVTRALMECPA